MNDRGLSDADHAALLRLATDAVWRVDHGHGGTLHELFTEDATVSFDGKVVLRGHGEIKAWGDERPGKIRHSVTNAHFWAEGPDEAVGNALEIVYYDPDNPGIGTSVPRMVAEWTYGCRRTAEGWKFASIDVLLLFERPDRADPDKPFDPWAGTSRAQQ